MVRMSKNAEANKSLLEIIAGLNALIDFASQPEKMSQQADAVSKWSVGQHVEHLTLSDEVILDGLRKLLAEPASGKPGKPRLIGRICLWSGFIPRGRGKAPQQVVPQGLAMGILLDRLEAVRKGFTQLEASTQSLASSTATVPHPVFGRLDACQWLRFTEIHHDHHHKIIRDIARALHG
jgi:hypothetical protein